jgi:hypothetical protein
MIGNQPSLSEKMMRTPDQKTGMETPKSKTLPDGR